MEDVAEEESDDEREGEQEGILILNCHRKKVSSLSKVCRGFIAQRLPKALQMRHDDSLETLVAGDHICMLLLEQQRLGLAFPLNTRHFALCAFSAGTDLHAEVFRLKQLAVQVFHRRGTVRCTRSGLFGRSRGVD